MNLPSIVIDGRIIFREQCRGIGRSVIGLVEQFPTSATDGTVKVLVAEDAESPFDLSGVMQRATIVETPLPVVSLHRVGELRRLLRSLDAGVLYVPYHPFTPLRPPCPVVSTVHDCIWEEDPRFAGGRLKQAAFSALTRTALRRAEAIVVPSAATAHAVGRFYPNAAVRGVVPNGVASTGRAGRLDPAARARLGLPERYVLHVGARRPHKNQALLVEMLAHLPEDVSLVLVGSPDPKVPDDVPATAARLGVERRVVSLHHVPDGDLASLYAGAEVFLFPSIVEGFGIPPLEAMDAGVPVVASAIPVVAEVCRDAAVMVSPFDPQGWAEAVMALRRDPALAERLVERGRSVVAASSWKAGGEELYSLLERVARGGGVAAR